MIRICVRVRILGPDLWALIYLGLSNKNVGPKTIVPTFKSLIIYVSVG